MRAERRPRAACATGGGGGGGVGGRAGYTSRDKFKSRPGTSKSSSFTGGEGGTTPSRFSALWAKRLHTAGRFASSIRGDDSQLLKVGASVLASDVCGDALSELEPDELATLSFEYWDDTGEGGLGERYCGLVS